MHTNELKPTPAKIIKLATQLTDKARYKVLLELLPTFDEEHLEDLQSDIEQILTERVFLGEEKVVHKPKPPEMFVEIKTIDHNPYAYLRAKDKSSQTYLGRVLLLPGRTYRLTHKSTQQTKVLHILRYEPDPERVLEPGEKAQVALIVQQLEPHAALKKYSFPQCMKSIFAKRDWQIECLPASTTSQAPTDKIASVAKPLLSQQISRPAASGTVITLVDKASAKQVMTCLEQWAMLSSIVPSNPQWNLMRYPGKATLVNQQGEMTLEYNTATNTLSVSQSIPTLVAQLKKMAWEVGNSPKARPQQQTIAQNLFGRLQFTREQRATELLAYLFELPSGQMLLRSQQTSSHSKRRQS